MGVPKFYRWISERYPCLSTVVKEYQIPEFDNLYLDMNGIIHVCSHPNDGDAHFRISEDKIFQDIFNYLDFLFRMIKPRKTFFMAVDGVAPRAKMNQQRGRRFRSAREAQLLEKQARDRGEVLPAEARFDSNCISPGTEFMTRLQDQLEQFVATKISTDPLWRDVKVYLSGHQTPGEGEHKVMDFIRTERSRPGYDPNTRHCLYGLDADLIMLGTCSHEPHFALLREEIVYGKKQNQKRLNVPEEITFHLLHLSLLREYLALEFQSVKGKISFEFNMESIVDDWVLMCFLVGNDFLPHLPNLHIAQNALPTLYEAYIDVLPSLGGYLNESGILNLERFEKFLARLCQFEYGCFTDIQADQKFLQSKRTEASIPNGIIDHGDTVPVPQEKERDPDEQRLLEKFDHLDIPSYDSDSESENIAEMEFRQHKRDYYINKLDYEEVNGQVMQEQAYGYVRAIQWNLHYYYHGVQSWNWFYPHHYAPYISDIRDFQNLDMRFELGKPFLPFQQLLSIMPSASKDLVPAAYRPLMESEDSPVVDYYPTDFSTDLNGKQHEWEAVVLIPFIDENRLLPAMKECESKLTEEESSRNSHSGHLLFTYSVEPLPPRYYRNTELISKMSENHAKVQVLDVDAFHLPIEKIKKGALEGVNRDVYMPGFPTFRHIAFKAFLKKEGIKVFQAITRNESMLLRITESTDEDLDDAPRSLLGKSVYVHWPHLHEALVVGVNTREARYTLEDDGKCKQTLMTSGDKEIFDMQAMSISEKYHSRYGIDVGDINLIVHCKTITGRKYICGSKGRITLEKQWAQHSIPICLQSVVKDLKEECPDVEQYRTLEELFPVGKTCFVIGHPHYGCQGEVVDPKPSNRPGRIVVKLSLPAEPNLEGVVRNERNLRQVYFMTAHQVAQQLGVNTNFVARITGVVYVQVNSRDAEARSRINIGLNLKFNRSGEEVPGYSLRANDSWLYSNKCCDVLKAYLTKYYTFLEKIQPLLERDTINIEDLSPDSNGTEEVKEIAKWLKEQECSQLDRVKSGSEMLDDGVVKAIEETVDKMKGQDSERSVVLDVQPKYLYSAALSSGWLAPDASATFRLFDRVVNVRENITVPVGLRGTITGLCKVEEGEPQLCEVVFDKPFLGGMQLRCSPNRGYRLLALSLVSLSHGTRQHKTQQLYQVPARRQQNSVAAGNMAAVPPKTTHHHNNRGSREVRLNEMSPDHKHKNRFHHSPNSPFEPQKSSQVSDGATEGNSDFASVWGALRKANSEQQQASQNAGVCAPLVFAPSAHHGTRVSIEELFKGAEKTQQNIVESPPTSSISALRVLMERTRATMGTEPIHYCVGIGTEPYQEFKAFVLLPNGKRYESTCKGDRASALHDVAQQALSFFNNPVIQLHPQAPSAVPARRPSVPLPFGNPPLPCALPGLRAQCPPPSEASLIPDSYVEVNRRLMEALPKEVPHWQTPRMIPPNVPTGLPGSVVPSSLHDQRMPFYHNSSLLGPPHMPRSAVFGFPQQGRASFLQTRMATPPNREQQHHHHHQSYNQQPTTMHNAGHGGEPANMLPQSWRQQPSTVKEPHRLSATASVFVPTQVLRNQQPTGTKPAGAPGKAAKEERKAGNVEMAVPKVSSTASNRLPNNKNKSSDNRGNKSADKEDAPKQQKQPQNLQSASAIASKPRAGSRDSGVGRSSTSGSGQHAEGKPKQRRSRLAVKFDNDPSHS